jgi:chromosome segregation ATPase
VATATAAAEAAHVPVKIVFVERSGSAPAAAAVEAAIGVIESQIGVQVGRVAKRAREEASTTLQAELEVEAERSEALQAELDEWLLSNAAQRRGVVASAARIAALEAQLARTSSNAAASAAKAEATVEAAKGGAAAARKKAKVAGQSLARARERIEVLEAKPDAPSSSGATKWTEEEVAEFEDHIGELTAELKVLKQEAKGNSTEYARKKGTVANMRGKFIELREARDLLKAARDENEDLKAALAEERANPLPGMKVPVYDIRRDSSKRGAPYDRHFEDTIAPAMLNTGATPEQINELIRKPQFNTHHTIPTHTDTPTHTLHTHFS